MRRRTGGPRGILLLCGRGDEGDEVTTAINSCRCSSSWRFVKKIFSMIQFAIPQFHLLCNENEIELTILRGMGSWEGEDIDEPEMKTNQRWGIVV